MNRPSPRLLLAASFAAVLLLLAGWVVLRSAPSTSNRDAARSAPAAAGEVSAVMQVLGQHAQALLHRDQPGWEAALDAAAAADSYRNQERSAFTNLVGVPLTVWRYLLVAPVTDPAVLGPAATRLGGRVVVLHVRLQYGLRLVDPVPTSKDEYLTAVQRTGGWKLAGDSDAETTGGPSWHGPWDFGPLATWTGPHTLVLGNPHRDLATYGKLVEQSVPVVAGVWGSAWNEHVAVLIPDSTDEFAAVTGDDADSHDIAAVAVADSINPDLSAPPDQAVLGARIVFNPTNLDRLDAAGRRLVVQHELTHIATRAATSDQMPTWLIEGFADYVGNLGSGRPVSDIAAELAGEVRRGTIPAALPTASDFDGADTRLPQVYEEAWLACRLIAQEIGQHGLVSFYRAVGVAARTDPAGATATAFRQLLHTTEAAFTTRWRSYLREQLR